MSTVLVISGHVGYIGYEAEFISILCPILTYINPSLPPISFRKKKVAKNSVLAGEGFGAHSSSS